LERSRTILLAGGGTGGHIYPNVAVWERLRAARPEWGGHFLVSRRPVDHRIATAHGLNFTALHAQPLKARPVGALTFGAGYFRARRQTARLIDRLRPAALVATGGFVAAPAAAAARAAGVPVVLVNLDATPGLASQLVARRADRVMTASEAAGWPAERIGLPLREAARAHVPAAEARRELGLWPETPTLLVTAGSQGAMSINRLMPALCLRPALRSLLADWQVLHLGGDRELSEAVEAYQRAGVPAKVLPHLEQMGLAWSAADLALSRAGAGSVGEAWAAGVPSVFLPYPYHKDQHQWQNAAPLEQSGGAIIRRDYVDPEENAKQLTEVLTPLLQDRAKLSAMRRRLEATAPPDGAAAVAQWVATVAGVA
jgi:UDP-N-acetylglucosamine--N-acetylmuramyl-(pentapeptide) pyrophosphoryl-undecaprenol N-acetylglucosamine transferase